MTTPERIEEIRRLFNEKRDGKIVGDLLEWVDSLTQQRDEARARIADLEKLVTHWPAACDDTTQHVAHIWYDRQSCQERRCDGIRALAVTAPPKTPTLGEKLLRDIFTDPGQRALEKAAEGFEAFGKAAAWPPATPVEEPADYSPLCAECEAADREQPMCNDCHATFQREHAARTARARRLGSAGPVKEDRP